MILSKPRLCIWGSADGVIPSDLGTGISLMSMDTHSTGGSTRGTGLRLHCSPRHLGAEYSPACCSDKIRWMGDGCKGGWISKCSFGPKGSKLDPKHNSSTSYSPISLVILWKHLRFLFTSRKKRAYPFILITLSQTITKTMSKAPAPHPILGRLLL